MFKKRNYRNIICLKNLKYNNTHVGWVRKKKEELD